MEIIFLHVFRLSSPNVESTTGSYDTLRESSQEKENEEASQSTESS